MSMYNINNIIVNKDSFTSNNSIDNIPSYKSPDNFSFMNETYTFLKSYHKDYNNINKMFYKNILESNNNREIINESFSDFFDKVSNIINKFIEFIKKIFKKFCTKMNQLFKSEKYLKNNKAEFDKFTSEDDFLYKGFEFTYLESSEIPESNAVSAFDADKLGDSVIDFVSDFTVNNTTLEDEYTDSPDTNMNNKATNKPKSLAIATNIQNKYDALMDNLDDFYDNFRAKLIKVDYDIDSTEWENELFKKFRDDYDTPNDITIDSIKIKEIYYRFTHYDANIKATEKIRNEIEKNYKKLEEGFRKVVKVIKTNNKINLNLTSTNSYVNTNLSNFTHGDTENIISTPEINDKLDIYMKAKVSQVHQMSSIHSLAFSAKITAIKDCFIQDKKILYKALSKIQSHSNKN